MKIVFIGIAISILILFLKKFKKPKREYNDRTVKNYRRWHK